MPTAEQIKVMLVALGYFAVIAAIYIVSVIYSYKRDKELPEKGSNPFIIAIMVSAFILTIIAFVNIFEKDFLRKYWWTSLIVFGCVLGFYWAMLRVKYPLSFEEQYTIFLETIDNFFKAKQYRGRIDYLPLDGYTTTKELGRENVGNWLMTANANKKVEFLFKIDKISKEIIELIPNPDTLLKQSIFGKPFPKAPKPISEEIAGEGEVEEEKTA